MYSFPLYAVCPSGTEGVAQTSETIAFRDTQLAIDRKTYALLRAALSATDVVASVSSEETAGTTTLNNKMRELNLLYDLSDGSSILLTNCHRR